MKTETANNIVDFVRSKGQATAKELVGHFMISYQAVFKQLKKLQNSGLLKKIGSAPKVYYIINEQAENFKTEALDKKLAQVIEENYYIVTSAGEIREGVNGFAYWCSKQNLPLEKTANEYTKTLDKYQVYKKDGIIDGLSKIKQTFKQINLDGLFYLDFYSIERFGKTKLGQLLLYAKQSQDKKLIRQLAEEIKPQVENIIGRHKISAVGFVPPTVKREVQFMKELKNFLELSLPLIAITKIKTPVIIPQKTLNKVQDRIENAQSTFVVDENIKYDNILLIDDAVGSGATLNEIAGRIKQKKLARNIIGLAVTGSFKGFDVISEV
jgi:hypoxanthine-guanine phosphoribosyltransferase/DNA-binding transcriptional regulator GbsR (MarR family)